MYKISKISLQLAGISNFDLSKNEKHIVFLFKWNLKNEKTEKCIAIFEQGIKNETNRDILLFLYMEPKNERKWKKTLLFLYMESKIKRHIVIFLYGILLRHSWIHWEAGNILWELSTAVCSRLSLDEYGSSLATA